MRKLLSTLGLLLACGCGSATSMPGTPEKSNLEPLVLTGAVVLAGASQTALSDHAVIISGDRIEAVVSSAEGARRIAGGARELSLRGMTVLPGLTDAHGHLEGLGASLSSVDLTGTTSYDEVIARVSDRAKTAAPGEWITGRGWDQNDWIEKEFPTAARLDRAVAGNPVWMIRIDGHAALGNSAALRAAGVTANTKDPDGGKILRDPSGEPTGVFIDAARDLVERSIPAPSREVRKRHIATAAQTIAASGLTEMHDAGADQVTIDLVRELIDEGQFPIRVYAMLGDNRTLLDEWIRRGPLNAYGNRLTVRSIKLYADGALGSRGAALLEPYSDDPSNRGLLLATPSHLLEVSKRALAHGFQLNVHAIGDRGVRNVLEAFESAGVRPKDRFRIEHLQTIALEDVPRLSRSGIISSMQPTHATSDMPWAEARVGAKRIRGAYAWRTVLEAGGRLALGSDFPVEAVSPFFGIYAAVTRQDQAGQPAGGWMPQERLTIAEAVRGFTADAAYAAFEEESRGTIEAGKLADLTVVEGNLMQVPHAGLWRIKPRYTIVGGAIVYDSASSKSSK